MRQLAATAIAGGVFMLAYLAFGLSLACSAAAALSAYVAGLFLFFRKGSQITTDLAEAAPEDVRQALVEASAKVDTIMELGKRVKKFKVKMKLDSMIAVARGTIDDIRKQPGNIRRARQFLNYYLDAVSRILSRYVDLTERNLDAPDVQTALDKAESLLMRLGEAFEKQRASLAQNDVLDLDAEIAVLETMLTTDGVKP